MLKKYFTLLFAVAALQGAVFAEDAVFSNSETQQFTLQPKTYKEIPEIPSTQSLESITPSADTSVQTTQKAITPSNSQLSNSNFLNAINNLDSAQVEIREQMSNYAALMAQAKSEYEAKKDEYNGYKKQYNELKKKMSNIEASKKKIQQNVNVNSLN